MKKILVRVIAFIFVVCCIAGCSSSCQRELKSLSSDFGGGLRRSVTIYDYNGNQIKQYSGKFDVSSSENEVFFDVDGKRIIIHGGIVINEEE